MPGPPSIGPTTPATPGRWPLGAPRRSPGSGPIQAARASGQVVDHIGGSARAYLARLVTSSAFPPSGSPRQDGVPGRIFMQVTLCRERSHMPHTARSDVGMEYLRYLGLRATATSGRLVALGRLRLGPRAALLDRITLSNEGRSGERAPSRRYGRVGGRRPVAVGSTRWNILCVCGS